jgi:hypothetical protein
LSANINTMPRLSCAFHFEGRRNRGIGLNGGIDPVGYTITIAPDDSSQATTTLRVEVEGAEARITDLHVRASQGAGLTAGQLPAVDLDQLLRAVMPAGGPAAITADRTTAVRTPETAPPAEASPVARPAPAEAEPVAEPASATEAAPEPAPPIASTVELDDAAAPAPGRATGASGRTGAGTSTARKATARKATARKATARKATARKAASKATARKAASKSAGSKATAPKPATAAKSTARSAGTGGKAAAPAKSGARKSSGATATRPAGRLASAKATAAKSVSPRGSAKGVAAKGSPAAKATARKAGKSLTKTAPSTANGSSRTYRRAPEDLASVLAQAGGVGAVADHYNVPRHTAQSWVRTLRRKASDGS